MLLQPTVKSAPAKLGSSASGLGAFPENREAVELIEPIGENYARRFANSSALGW